MTQRRRTTAPSNARPRERPPIVSFIGPSGSGKTTILERLVPVLTKMGHRVAVIKHVHHKGFDLDQPGKDSYRFTEAGAEIVLLSSPERIALLEKTPQEWELAQLAALIGQRADLVLTEGYRGRDAPQVAVGGLPSAALDPHYDSIVAVVSDDDVAAPLPCFRFDEAQALARWLEAFCGLTESREIS